MTYIYQHALGTLVLTINEGAVSCEHSVRKITGEKEDASMHCLGQPTFCTHNEIGHSKHVVHYDGLYKSILYRGTSSLPICRCSRTVHGPSDRGFTDDLLSGYRYSDTFGYSQYARKVIIRWQMYGEIGAKRTVDKSGQHHIWLSNDVNVTVTTPYMT